MRSETARVLLVKLTEPDHAGEFTDVLIRLAIAADEGEDKAVRLDAERQAAELLDDLAEALAAELTLREQVPA